MVINRDKTQSNKPSNEPPITKPIPTIANPLSLPLLNKAITDIIPNTIQVIPNVTPNKYHGTNIATVDKATPIKTEYIMAGTRMECFPLAITRLTVADMAIRPITETISITKRKKPAFEVRVFALSSPSPGAI